MQSKSQATKSKWLPLLTLQLLSSPPTVREKVHDELAIIEPRKGTPCPFDFFLLTLLPPRDWLRGHSVVLSHPSFASSTRIRLR